MKIKGGIASKRQALVDAQGRLLVAVAGGAGLDFSTSEQDTGVKWVDGKTVFRKVVDLGAMPNATEKNVLHNITGLDTLIFMHGATKDPAGVFWFPLPYPDTSATASIEVDIDNADIEITTGVNRSSFTQSHIILYYTKT